MKLFLDKGHYGLESGCVNGSLREDNLTNAIVNKTYEKLSSKYQVKDTDVLYGSGTLEERVNRANQNNCDLFISVHVNSTVGGTGVETLVSQYSGQATRDIANKVNKYCVQETQLRDRGIRVDYDYLKKNLYVLKNTKMSACLVECGFIQNDWNDVNLRIEQYSNALCKFIAEHYNLSQKPSKPTDDYISIEELKNRGYKGVRF